MCACMGGACACVVWGSEHMQAHMQEGKGLWRANGRSSQCLGSFLGAGWQEKGG